MSLDQNALLKNMLTSIDGNSSEKVPTQAYIHTLVERIGMGTELTAGANLTEVANELSSNLVNLENSTVVMDYATAINITTLKTWTESSYAISSPPAGFTFSDIVSITAFAQDGYGDRWLRVMANQRANASGTLSLMGYCINTTGSIPIIVRVIFKK